MGICSYNLSKHLIIIILKNATDQNLSPKCGQFFSKFLIKKEGICEFYYYFIISLLCEISHPKKKKDVPNIISPQQK